MGISKETERLLCSASFLMRAMSHACQHRVFTLLHLSKDHRQRERGGLLGGIIEVSSANGVDLLLCVVDDFLPLSRSTTSE